MNKRRVLMKRRKYENGYFFRHSLVDSAVQITLNF